MKTVTIELPGIQAISRNDTTGHWFRYKAQLKKAEDWMRVFGKRFEYHFENPVVVTITAYFDTRGRKKAIDAPNIDDKIFTDILIRYVNRTVAKVAGKKIVEHIERPVWFIEDDNPKYLLSVSKYSIPSDHYKVIIQLQEVLPNGQV